MLVSSTSFAPAESPLDASSGAMPTICIRMVAGCAGPYFAAWSEFRAVQTRAGLLYNRAEPL